MKMQVKIVPESTPNAKGKWIPWKVKLAPKGRFLHPDSKGPKGFFIVECTYPYRKGMKRRYRHKEVEL